MPVTSCPCHRIRPVVGASRPAINRMIEVLPESVGPSSTFIVPASSVRSVGWICTRPLTRFDTPSNVSVIPSCPRSSLCGARGGIDRAPLLPHPFVQRRDLRLAHLQPQPRAPPDHIRRLARIFPAHLPAHLGPGQRRAELGAQILRRLRVTQNLPRLGAISARQTPRPVRAKE